MAEAGGRFHVGDTRIIIDDLQTFNTCLRRVDFEYSINERRIVAQTVLNKPTCGECYGQVQDMQGAN